MRAPIASIFDPIDLVEQTLCVKFHGTVIVFGYLELLATHALDRADRRVSRPFRHRLEGLLLPHETILYCVQHVETDGLGL